MTTTVLAIPCARMLYYDANGNIMADDDDDTLNTTKDYANSHSVGVYLWRGCLSSPRLCTGIPTTVSIESVALGEEHVLLLSSVGTLYSYGAGLCGQLGLSDFTNRSLPCHVAMPNDSTVHMIAAGKQHSAAITAIGGQLLCWGRGMEGQVGTNMLSCFNSPQCVTMPDLDTIKPIDDAVEWTLVGCGEYYTIATTSLCDTYSWGNGYALGLGKYSKADENVKVPMRIPELKGESISSLSCGPFHVIAVSHHNRVYSNHINGHMEGLASVDDLRIPYETPTLSPHVQLEQQYHHHHARSTSPTSPLSRPVSPEVTVLEPLPGYRSSSPFVSPNQDSKILRSRSCRNSGNNSTYDDLLPLAGTRNYTFWVWGKGGAGQLGLGHVLDLPSPQILDFFNSNNIFVPVLRVAVGMLHSLALMANGDVYAWGTGGPTGLGQGQFLVPKQVPLDFFNGSRVVDLAAGGYHSLFLTLHRPELSCSLYYVNSSNGTDDSKSKALPSSLRLVQILRGVSNGLLSVSAGWEQSCCFANNDSITETIRELIYSEREYLRRLVLLDRLFLRPLYAYVVSQQTYNKVASTSATFGETEAPTIYGADPFIRLVAVASQLAYISATFVSRHVALLSKATSMSRNALAVNIAASLGGYEVCHLFYAYTHHLADLVAGDVVATWYRKDAAIVVLMTTAMERIVELRRNACNSEQIRSGTGDITSFSSGSDCSMSMNDMLSGVSIEAGSDAVLLSLLEVPFNRLRKLALLFRNLAATVSTESAVVATAKLWEEAATAAVAARDDADRMEHFWKKNSFLSDILMAHGRRLLRSSQEFPLFLRKHSLNLTTHTFFFFTDIFVHVQSFSSIISRDLYDISVLWVDTVEAKSPSQSFSILLFSPEKSINLFSSSNEETREWLLALCLGIHGWLKFHFDDDFDDLVVNDVDADSPQSVELENLQRSLMNNTRRVSYTFSRNHSRFPGGHYEGAMVRGLMNGMGSMVFADGQKYNGNWYDGLRFGKGVLASSDGIEIYHGDWRNDNRHGHGHWTEDNIGVYSGRFELGLPHGFGIQRLGNVVYIGSWRSGRRHGYGAERNEICEDRYIGQWEDDVRCGLGLWIRADGSFYCGFFAHGLPAGFGSLLSDSVFFEGKFWCGNPHGAGVLTFPCGNAIEGDVTTTSSSTLRGARISGSLRSAVKMDHHANMQSYEVDNSASLMATSVPGCVAASMSSWLHMGNKLDSLPGDISRTDACAALCIGRVIDIFGCRCSSSGKKSQSGVAIVESMRWQHLFQELRELVQLPDVLEAVSSYLGLSYLAYRKTDDQRLSIQSMNNDLDMIQKRLSSLFDVNIHNHENSSEIFMVSVYLRKLVEVFSITYGNSSGGDLSSAYLLPVAHQDMVTMLVELEMILFEVFPDLANITLPGGDPVNIALDLVAPSILPHCYRPLFALYCNTCAPIDALSNRCLARFDLFSDRELCEYFDLHPLLWNEDDCSSKKRHNLLLTATESRKPLLSFADVTVNTLDELDSIICTSTPTSPKVAYFENPSSQGLSVPELFKPALDNLCTLENMLEPCSLLVIVARCLQEISSILKPIVDAVSLDHILPVFCLLLVRAHIGHLGSFTKMMEDFALSGNDHLHRGIHEWVATVFKSALLEICSERHTYV